MIRTIKIEKTEIGPTGINKPYLPMINNGSLQEKTRNEMLPMRKRE